MSLGNLNPKSSLAVFGLHVLPLPESHKLPLLCICADGFAAWQSPTISIEVQN